ncbi:MAG: type II toxin-antitoxin system PemK/MazF family toxin [Pirellulales bacterium]
MKFGDIFICRFPFTSGNVSKPRPALVLFDLGTDAIICRLTSASPRGTLDLPVSDWQVAGLAKPTVARLDRLVTAEKSLLHVRLGELSDTDKATIRAQWNAQMQL